LLGVLGVDKVREKTREEKKKEGATEKKGGRIVGETSTESSICFDEEVKCRGENRPGGKMSRGEPAKHI